MRGKFGDVICCVRVVNHVCATICKACAGIPATRISQSTCRGYATIWRCTESGVRCYPAFNPSLPPQIAFLLQPFNRSFGDGPLPDGPPAGGLLRLSRNPSVLARLAPICLPHKVRHKVGTRSRSRWKPRGGFGRFAGALGKGAVGLPQQMGFQRCHLLHVCCKLHRFEQLWINTMGFQALRLWQLYYKLHMFEHLVWAPRDETNWRFASHLWYVSIVNYIGVGNCP